MTQQMPAFDFNRNRNWVRHYYDFDTASFEKSLRTRSEDYWHELGRRRALALFKAASGRVPAYKDFLQRNKVRPELVRTMGDFEKIPATDKNNYAAEYPLNARCWDGKLDRNLVAMSSGTSGEPALWPRSGYQEFEAAVIHELIYRSTFAIQKRKTLLLIGFPMGVYVSGVATLLPSWLVSGKKYDLTVVSAGNNKTEMLRMFSKLKDEYDQVVLVGHPFFIKDVIETGRKQGLRWSDNQLGLLFCSEGFNETWRSYVTAQAGKNSRAINTYGSSEMLLMAHETPLTVALRRALERNSKLRRQLTGTELTPNLFQYNPLFRYIESVNGELCFTSASGIPLIRYNLHDSGTILPLKHVRKAVRGYGLEKSVPLNNAWHLPLVALAGRSDHAIVFYAANIYPEHVHTALNHDRFLKKITGKFAMRKDYLKNMDQFLEINIELRPDVKPAAGLASSLQKHIVERLRDINMEYLFLCENLDKNLTPRVSLWPYQSEKYFKPGLKPRYIIK